MWELGNIDLQSGIDATFEEISRFSMQCRYRNCTHIHEDGCVVLSALKEGKISMELYQSFLKLKKESVYYGMSYSEKKKKR